MSFRIEYLKETAREDSVCHALVSHGTTLEAAEAEAFAGAVLAKERGATGFQIRHLNAVDNTKFLTAGHFGIYYLVNYVREHGWLSLEDAHWKLSGLPAIYAGFADRGTLVDVMRPVAGPRQPCRIRLELRLVLCRSGRGALQ